MDHLTSHALATFRRKLHGKNKGRCIRLRRRLSMRGYAMATWRWAEAV